MTSVFFQHLHVHVFRRKGNELEQNRPDLRMHGKARLVSPRAGRRREVRTETPVKLVFRVKRGAFTRNSTSIMLAIIRMSPTHCQPVHVATMTETE